MGGGLARSQALVYGLGHVLNDVCASCWFSYLVVFLTKVRELPGSATGTVMLCGQIADGAATPLMGLLSDRSTSRFGRRRTFVLGGALMVFVFFGSMLGSCTLCTLTGDSVASKTVFYAACAALFNVGWASGQVSHLALVPELSDDSAERVLLNSVRHAFTILSNLFVFAATWALLGKPEHARTAELGPSDGPAFESLAVLCLVVGGACALVFLVFIREPPRPRPHSRERSAAHSWRHWFSVAAFYHVGVVYTCTRVFVNVSQIYLPEYLLDSLGMEKSVIAKVPLLVYTSSMVATVFINGLSRHFGRLSVYMLGNLLTLAACVVFLVLPHLFSTHPHEAVPVLYSTCVVLGMGTAISLVCSVTMQADLVGRDTDSGAFVYGALSCIEKVVNGVIIATMEFTRPACTDGTCGQGDFFAKAMPWTCAIASVLAAVGVSALHQGREVEERRHRNARVQLDGVGHDDDDDDEARSLLGPSSNVPRVVN